MNMHFSELPEEKLWKALCHYVSPACGGMFVQRQQALSHYRADFVVTGKDRNRQEVKINVECDGHEWHEKTPEQAEKDKRRDKIFQANGYVVMRFTGSQIARSPDQCALEVRAMIAVREDQWLSKHGGQRQAFLSSVLIRNSPAAEAERKRGFRTAKVDNPRHAGFKCMGGPEA